MAQAAARKRPASRSRTDAAPGSAQAVRRIEQERTDILVKAVGQRGDRIAGYYNLTRFRDGDTFFLNKEEDFSEKWMVAVDANREEIPEETERLTKIAKANSRKVAGEVALDRAVVRVERDPEKEIEKAEADLKAAKAEAPKRRTNLRSTGSNIPAPPAGSTRAIAGTDYERHEDFSPNDPQGPEPQGPGSSGRASDKNVA